jgi:hypothetical protein
MASKRMEAFPTYQREIPLSEATYPVLASQTLKVLSLPPLTTRSLLKPGQPMAAPHTSLDGSFLASLGPLL